MKKCIIVSAVTALATIALMILVIAGIKIVPSLFLTKEERVLRDFMGEYTVAGFARIVDSAATTVPISRGSSPISRPSYYFFDEHSVTMLRANIPTNSQTSFLRTSPLEYRCIKVENAKEDGLRNIVTDEQFYQPTDDEVYAICVYEPNVNELSDDTILADYREKSDHGAVYYVVGDKYYATYLNENFAENYELEKVV